MAALVSAVPDGSGVAASARCPSLEIVEVLPSASAATRPVALGKNRTIQASRTPIATLEDVVKVGLDEPTYGILLTFRPAAAERMERITSRPDFPMAVVVDGEALLSVVLKGGYGIGKDGLQVSLDDGRKAGKIARALGRCVAGPEAKN